MTGIVLGIGAVLGIVILLIIVKMGGEEDRLFKVAMDDYQAGRFGHAVDHFQQYTGKFPDGKHQPESRFLTDLSRVREAVHIRGVDGKTGLDDMTQCARAHETDPYLKTYVRDAGASIVVIEEGVVGRKPEREVDLSTVELVQRSLTLSDDLKKMTGDDPLTPEQRDKFKKDLSRLQELARRNDDRRRFVQRIKERIAQPGFDRIKTIRQWLDEEKGSELPTDPEVLQLVQNLYERSVQEVHYISGQPEVVAVLGAAPQLGFPGALPYGSFAWMYQGGMQDDGDPGLLPAPLLEGTPAPPVTDDQIVLALARGVLSGLRASNGVPRWSIRVGVDTSILPDRLPATDDRPEMCLVVSADTHNLMAMDVQTGDIRWRYPLGAPSLGRPVILENRAFVPTYNGIVHEVELNQGRLLGRYFLGQRLTVGGASQPGTSLLYFPADDSCIFVLDIAKQQCHGILLTDHPGGSIRSEPIIATWGPRNPQGIPDPDKGAVIVPQADGLHSMVLRTFDLPIPPGITHPQPKPTDPRLTGWSWFRPFNDSEKLVVVTDAGLMQIFGIPMMNNLEQYLWLAAQYPTEKDLTRRDGSSRPILARAQVVHGQNSDLWILSEGRLRRMQLTFDRKQGPRVVLEPNWTEQVLGSPLHEGQVDDKAEVLFVVTHSLVRQVCYATAVKADQGEIRWKRQLGLVCQGDPVPLGKKVLLQDQGGGLFLFDPTQSNAAYRMVQAPPAMDIIGTPYLVPAADDASVLQFATVRASGEKKGLELLIRRYPDLPGAAASVEISSPLAGRPAVGKSFILLPLADGTLIRLSLDGKNKKEGPDWRPRHLDSTLHGFVAWLGGEEFVSTNGQRGIKLYRWPAEGDYEPLQSREFPARLTSAALVLPGRSPGDERLCMADADGTVYLLSARTTRDVRQWQLKGKVIAGPFLRAGHIGCVLERGRMVWLDPTNGQKLWDQKLGDGIVGEPHLVNGLLVVADQSGRYTTLDPVTGKPVGTGYTLRSSVAPGASPVPYANGLAFAPLTDGMIFLMPVGKAVAAQPAEH